MAETGEMKRLNTGISCCGKATHRLRPACL